MALTSAQLTTLKAAILADPTAGFSGKNTQEPVLLTLSTCAHTCAS